MFNYFDIDQVKSLINTKKEKNQFLVIEFFTNIYGKLKIKQMKIICEKCEQMTKYNLEDYKLFSFL